MNAAEIRQHNEAVAFLQAGGLESEVELKNGNGQWENLIDGGQFYIREGYQLRLRVVLNEHTRFMRVLTDEEKRPGDIVFTQNPRILEASDDSIGTKVHRQESVFRVCRVQPGVSK